jgi:hypothetical protein
MAILSVSLSMEMAGHAISPALGDIALFFPGVMKLQLN